MDRETETVINKLMSDLKAAQDLSAYLAASNKKLREALRVIRGGLGDPQINSMKAYEIADAALKEGE